MSTFLSSKDGVKARKRFQCVWCREPIEKGELYDRRVGVDCGDMWTMRMHPECQKRELETPWNDREDWYDSFNEGPVFDRPKSKDGGKQP